MRKILLLLVCIVSNQYGEKIGFVNMEKVLNEYLDLRDARRELNKIVQEHTQKLDSLKRVIDSLKVDYERKRIIMTDEQKIISEREIRSLEKRYNEMWEKIWGKNGEVKRKTQEIIEPLLVRVRETVSKISNDLGYSLILDSSKDGVLFIRETDDLTDLVLQELNKTYVRIPETPPGLKKRIAVFPLREKNQEAIVREFGTKVANYLILGLRNSPKIEPLPLGEIRAQMNRENITTQTITEEVARKMAGTLRADVYVYGSCEVIGEEAIISVFFYSLEENKLIYQKEERVNVAREEEISIKVQNIAKEFSQVYSP